MAPTRAASGGSEHTKGSPGEIGGARGGGTNKLYILSYSQGINALSDMCISRLRRELGGLSPPVADTRLVDGVVELLLTRKSLRRRRSWLGLL